MNDNGQQIIWYLDSIVASETSHYFFFLVQKFLAGRKFKEKPLDVSEFWEWLFDSYRVSVGQFARLQVNFKHT